MLSVLDKIIYLLCAVFNIFDLSRLNENINRNGVTVEIIVWPYQNNVIVRILRGRRDDFAGMFLCTRNETRKKKKCKIKLYVIWISFLAKNKWEKEKLISIQKNTIAGTYIVVSTKTIRLARARVLVIRSV